MSKRGALGISVYFVILISLSGFAYASHSVSSEVQPSSTYESITTNFTITVRNSFWSANSIYEVFIQTDGMDVVSITTPIDWTGSINGSDIYYSTQTGAISSWGDQNFALELTAQGVNQNTTYNWTIDTTDDNNETEQTTIEITVFDDNTPLVLSDSSPSDGALVKQGTEIYHVNITAIDPETGVAEVNFSYRDCTSNITNMISLTSDNDTFSGDVNLSSYTDSTDICFNFSARNNGDVMSSYSGTLTVDGSLPSIELVTADNQLVNSGSSFSFIARDNLAATMSCELLVDGNVEASATASNNATTLISAENVSEGTHDWAVRCTDLVGWTNTSETRTYTLDKTSPEISVTSPSILVIAENGTITISVTDNHELDEVKWEHDSVFTVINKSEYTSDDETDISIDTTGWPEGSNDVTVYANDTAGNSINETFGFTVDKTAPTVTLVSPVNDVGENGLYTFDTSDNYDSLIECTLYVDDDAEASTTVNTSLNTTASITETLSPGQHTWRIQCSDDAGNVGVSETWNVTVIASSQSSSSGGGHRGIKCSFGRCYVDGRCVACSSEEQTVSQSYDTIEAGESGHGGMTVLGCIADSECEDSETCVEGSCVREPEEDEVYLPTGAVVGLTGEESSPLWLLLLLGLVGAGMIYSYKKGFPFRRKNETLDLDSYLDQRLKP